MTTLANLSLASLVSLHNAAIVDYAPAGMVEVSTFKSKAKAIAALDAVCVAGNLAIEFDGDNAVIVDAMQGANAGDGYGPNDGEGGDVDGGDVDGGDVDGGDVDGGDVDGGDVDGGDVDGGDAEPLHGDAKGKARAWGFVTAGAEWLAANPRGSDAREAYRTERRKAARMARKAERKAKEVAQDVAMQDSAE